MGMIDPWRGLAYFESADYIDESYKRRHNIKTKQTRAKSVQMSTQLVQGRQYFDAANKAGELTKPLLLYYGVLSLSRGLILYLDRNMREEGLDKAHGVQIDGWERLFTGSTKHGVRFDEVTLTFSQSGTFNELCAATANTRIAFLPMSGETQGFYHRRAGTSAFPKNTTLRLKDVLARVPQLDSAYEAVFGEFPSSLQVRIESLAPDPNNTSVSLCVNGTETVFPDKETVANLLSLPIACYNSTVEHHSPYHMFRFVGPSLKELNENLPAITEITSALSSTDRILYIMAPFPNKIELSLLSITFLMSYSLGMLVRYYPSIWTKLSMRESGDRIFPILRAAMLFTEKEFPRLILDELEDLPKDKLEFVPNPHTWFDAY